MRNPSLSLMRPFGKWTTIVLFLFAFLGTGWAEEEGAPVYEGHPQFSHFPKPLSLYEHAEGAGAWQMIKERAAQEPFNVAATIIFVLAVMHTFVAGIFREWAHDLEKRHLAKHGEDTERVSFWAVTLHFFGEVEAVFGLWIVALAGTALYFHGWADLRNYLGHDVNFTEPLFVIVIMAIAASRPVVKFAEACIGRVAALRQSTPAAWWLAILTVAPLMGSLITEPAAMTLAALLLSQRLYSLAPSRKLAYGTLGLLFVNISVGGTLTHFAAPPILMVAAPWKWDTAIVFGNIGWKMVVAILINNAAYFLVFRKELRSLASASARARVDDRVEEPVPREVTAVHLFFLAWTVFTNHYPALFIGGFLFFLGFVEATRHHQSPVSLRSPLLVGFFLGALIVHGRCQSWWIEPLLTSANLPEWGLLLGAAVLTMFNDNAAITYLAAQAPGLGDFAKYAVVAGAVAAGGMTVIANAPNPAGQSLLGHHFAGNVQPGKLALAALLPTVVCILILLILRSPLMG
ncbi:putative Na+/H+ antiporter [Verrucomicrobium sp. BvORR034]|uniref:putative Na+/H+ antiporter n=1 Tax=Verrucomicrobium sp. BvORR034 TaxID=1396418 RepID=UPI0006788ED3|nr:putative Na+/H+ antiporter [Verrucomicrobium sp. BvORR034]